MTTRREQSHCCINKRTVEHRWSSRQQLDSRHLVALLAHDLRGPIAALRASSEILLDDISPAERHELAQYLGRQIEGLDRLTHDVIDALRPCRAGETWFTDVDLAATARGVVEDLKLDARVGQTVVVRGTAVAWTERGRVRAILRNLVGNAIKYSPPSSTITVQLSSDVHHAFVSVCDSGDGIDNDKLSRIFAPFYRVPGAQERAEGHGLGLYIARLLARSCAGDIRVASKPGRGATFTVVLPLRPRARAVLERTVAARRTR